MQLCIAIAYFVFYPFVDKNPNRATYRRGFSYIYTHFVYSHTATTKRQYLLLPPMLSVPIAFVVCVNRGKKFLFEIAKNER